MLPRRLDHDPSRVSRFIGGFLWNQSDAIVVESFPGGVSIPKRIEVALGRRRMSFSIFGDGRQLEIAAGWKRYGQRDRGVGRGNRPIAGLDLLTRCFPRVE